MSALQISIVKKKRKRKSDTWVFPAAQVSLFRTVRIISNKDRMFNFLHGKRMNSVIPLTVAAALRGRQKNGLTKSAGEKPWFQCHFPIQLSLTLKLRINGPADLGRPRRAAATVICTQNSGQMDLLFSFNNRISAWKLLAASIEFWIGSGHYCNSRCIQQQRLRRTRKRCIPSHNRKTFHSSFYRRKFR